jgi:hypothetical protein
MEESWNLIVLGIIGVLALGALKLMAVTSHWKQLAADFPMASPLSVLAKFPNAISTAGGVRFSRGGAGKLAITDQGLHVSIFNPFMADLLIPFSSIKTVSSLTFFGHTTISLEIQHAVPLTLRLPAEAIPLLKGKVSDHVFQQNSQIDSISDLLNNVRNHLKKD